MKILVTGSSGLVGSAAYDFFLQKGDEVIGLDSNMRSYFFGTPKKETHNDIDIRDKFSVEELFRNYKFDAIIHAAAQPSHDWAQQEPLTDFDINARGTLILLEATRKYCPDAVFVYVSTDKVYGENMKAGVTEGDTRYLHYYPAFGFDESVGLDFAGQRSLFGCSKTAADIYVQEYGNYFGMKTVCFRPGCITGKNHAGAEQHGFLAYLAKCIKEGKTYRIYGYKGKQVRDQIHAYDLASAFWYFIQNPKVGAIYNIGGGMERSVSILEAISLIQKELNLGKIDPDTNFWRETFSFEEARKGDRQWDVHDVSKFRGDYPEWKYTYSLQDIIKDICNTA